MISQVKPISTDFHPPRGEKKLPSTGAPMCTRCSEVLPHCKHLWSKTIIPTGLSDYLIFFFNLFNSVLHSKAQSWNHGDIWWLQSRRGKSNTYSKVMCKPKLFRMELMVSNFSERGWASEVPNSLSHGVGFGIKCSGTVLTHTSALWYPATSILQLAGLFADVDIFQPCWNRIQ